MGNRGGGNPHKLDVSKVTFSSQVFLIENVQKIQNSNKILIIKNNPNLIETNLKLCSKVLYPKKLPSCRRETLTMQ